MEKSFEILNDKYRSFVHEYCFRIAEVNFRLLTNEAEVIFEIIHYLPTVAESLQLVNEEVVELRYINDKELETYIRKMCLSKINHIVHSKKNVTYRKMQVENTKLFVSVQRKYSHSVIVRSGIYTIISSTKTSTSIRIPLRIAREIALRKMENRGGCLTHSAALSFDKGSKGLLIIGDQGCGKSTIMWELLLAGDAEFISNDMLILSKSANQVHIFGWSLPIRLGMGTVQATNIDLTGRNYRRKQLNSFWEQKALESEKAIENWANPVKLEITPLEVSNIIGREIRSYSYSKVLVFPKLKIGAGRIKIEPINTTIAKNILSANIREPEDIDFLKGWLDIRTVTDEFLTQRKKEILNSLLILPKYLIKGDPKYLIDYCPLILENCLQL